MTLINTQLLTSLIRVATITTVTYIGTNPEIFNNYHLRKKSSNVIMTFWEWIKSILNIKKVLKQITKTRQKQKIEKKIRQKSCKRYYIQGKRGIKSRVATKRSQIPNILPYLICITSFNETGNHESFESDYLIVGVNNHAYKVIFLTPSATFVHCYTNIIRVYVVK